MHAFCIWFSKCEWGHFSEVASIQKNQTKSQKNVEMKNFSLLKGTVLC